MRRGERAVYLLIAAAFTPFAAVRGGRRSCRCAKLPIVLAIALVAVVANISVGAAASRPSSPPCPGPALARRGPRADSEARASRDASGTSRSGAIDRDTRHGRART